MGHPDAHDDMAPCACAHAPCAAPSVDRMNDMSHAFVRVLVVVFRDRLLDPQLAARPQAPTPVTAAAGAIRSNNLGVASMNQQKFEAALKHFEDAAAADALAAGRADEPGDRAPCPAALRSGADAARSRGEGAERRRAGLVQPGTAAEKPWRRRGGAGGVHARQRAAAARRARALLRRPPGQSAAAVRHARSRSSSGRSSSIRSSCPPSSASRARFQRAGQDRRRQDAHGSLHAADAGEGRVGDEPRLRRSGTAVAGRSRAAAAVGDRRDSGDVRRRRRAARRRLPSQPHRPVPARAGA